MRGVAILAASLGLGLCALGAKTGSKKTAGFKEYCIVGGGPAGLQMAYFLGKAKRDYVIFERNFSPGSFFEVFPRHRKLISINKRFTGRESVTAGGKDFNLRHDWHSLISDDDSLLMRHFSSKLYPSADEFLAYLKAFADKTKPKIRYGREVVRVKDIGKGNGTVYKLRIKVVKKPPENEPDSGMGAQRIPTFTKMRCKFLLMATGMAKEIHPNIGNLKKYAESYGTFDTDPKGFTNKSVAIIGGGNSGFEVMKSIMDEAAYVHLFAKTKKMAWETHYPGDLRSINAITFDHYQLKSQDVLYVHLTDKPAITKRTVSGMEPDLCFQYADEAKFAEHAAKEPHSNSNHSLSVLDRYKGQQEFCYHRIIYATGWKFDKGPLKGLSRDHATDHGRLNQKFPLLEDHYESFQFKNMYFIGVNSHGLDYKKSSGGFIHGFRYSVRKRHHCSNFTFLNISISFSIAICLNNIRAVMCMV
jgi:cation diffusion facilitator CzcD-associated flavoprotein CzcO